MDGTPDKNLRSGKSRSPLLHSHGKVAVFTGPAGDRHIESALDISPAEEMMMLRYKEAIRKKIMNRIKSL